MADRKRKPEKTVRVDGGDPAKETTGLHSLRSGLISALDQKAESELIRLIRLLRWKGARSQLIALIDKLYTRALVTDSTNEYVGFLGRTLKGTVHVTDKLTSGDLIRSASSAVNSFRSDEGSRDVAEGRRELPHRIQWSDTEPNLIILFDLLFGAGFLDVDSTVRRDDELRVRELTASAKMIADCFEKSNGESYSPGVLREVKRQIEFGEQEPTHEDELQTIITTLGPVAS